MCPDLKNQFMLDPEIIFLNHGSFGACVKPVYENLLQWQQKLEKEPVKFFEDTISIFFTLLFVLSISAHWYLILKNSNINEHNG